MTMIFSFPSTETKCGKLNHLWQYCITVLVVMPSVALALNIIAYCTRMVGLTVIPGVVSLAIAVWGVLTWAGLGECDAVYHHLYPDLLLLFKIYVVINALYFLIFLCVIVSRTRTRAPGPPIPALGA